jgi:cobalamin biosynthesis protein CobD/CbiB
VISAPDLLVGALLLAWFWDAVSAKPRNALHPVYWLGRLLTPFGHFSARLCAAMRLQQVWWNGRLERFYWVYWH